MIQISEEVSSYHIIKYLQISLEKMQAAERFVEGVRTFMNRDFYGPLMADGTINENHPACRILCEGSEKERNSGMMISMNASITPWSLCPMRNLDFNSKAICINGIYYRCADSMAYIMDRMFPRAAKHIFVSRDIHGECADMFFPIGAVDANQYIRVTVGGRYLNTFVYCFEGNPEDFAKTVMRDIRVSEFPDRRKRDVIHCPLELPLTYKDCKWEDPRPVMLPDVMKVAQSLRYQKNEDGEPYLIG